VITIDLEVEKAINAEDVFDSLRTKTVNELVIPDSAENAERWTIPDTTETIEIPIVIPSEQLAKKDRDYFTYFYQITHNRSFGNYDKDHSIISDLVLPDNTQTACYGNQINRRLIVASTEQIPFESDSLLRSRGHIPVQIGISFFGDYESPGKEAIEQLVMETEEQVINKTSTGEKIHEMEIYPTIAHYDPITIEFDFIFPTQVTNTLYNILGQQLSQETFMARPHINHYLPTSDLSTGTYFYHSETSFSNAIGKFVIIK